MGASLIYEECAGNQLKALKLGIVSMKIKLRIDKRTIKTNGQELKAKKKSKIIIDINFRLVLSSK
jgi:hypothetical protein